MKLHFDSFTCRHDSALWPDLASMFSTTLGSGALRYTEPFAQCPKSPEQAL